MAGVSLEREDFRLWLASKDPDEVVGQTNEGLQCPGTSFLRAMGLGCPVVSYSGVGYWVRGPLRLVELTSLQWLSDFAEAVDRRYGRWIEVGRNLMRVQPADVTAKEALTVLDSLEFDAART